MTASLPPAHEDFKTKMAGKGSNGLMNVGNSCYINTAIQCLGHCSNFLEFVLSGKYTSADNNDNKLLWELRELFIQLWIKDNGVIPNRFLNHLRQNIKSLEIHEQNDIQEFLGVLIDKLNQSIAKQVNPDKALEALEASRSNADTLYEKLKRRLDKAWIQGVCKEMSPLVDFFYGQTVVQILCGHCQKIHHSYELFVELFLSIPMTNSTEKRYSVNECLEHCMQEETLNLEQGHEWKCDHCNQKAPSVKSTKICRLPHVLILCLKRFSHDLRKIDTRIDIPKTIDLAPYMIGQTYPTYNLASVACHAGSFGHGHYYALCKNMNGQWYNIDDTLVRGIGPDPDVSNNAYVLFYEMAT